MNMPSDNHANQDDTCGSRPLRVVRVLTRPNLGGPTRQAIALWHAHRELGVETLLVSGVVGSEEVQLSPADHGVPAAPADGSAAGWLQLPDIRRGVNPFADRRAMRALPKIIRQFRADVVHTHTSKAGLIGRKAAWAERVPVTAHTFHGHVLKDYFGRLPSMLLAALERRLARRTHLLFAISPSCADELADCRVAARDRFEVIAPAVAVPVAVARTAAREQLGIEAEQWRVCAVGRLVPIKRLADFVMAIAGAAELHGDVVGDGPERASLQQLATQHAGGRIHIRGAEPDIARLLLAYDAVVLPSVREGCPLVAIEAFAAGVPVVGYDVPGVRDALSHFGRGVLVPVAEGPAGLARALAALRADGSMQSRLVSDARKAVHACSPPVVAAALLSAYRKAAARDADSRYPPS
ncbi:MAG: glycosyltransferase involved in cell wall biosynthesis [Planctomycetota bacterium]|jgi:glycosyltransferase involved in cell wall biosynthesis